MKKKRLLLSLGALLCALFLSGCMAAMVPAMILGHASHGQRGPAHGSDAETCACEGAADDPTTTAATPVPPPVNHEHRP